MGVTHPVRLVLLVALGVLLAIALATIVGAVAGNSTEMKSGVSNGGPPAPRPN